MVINNSGNFFALMIWKGMGSDVIFTKWQLSAGNDKFKHPEKALPKVTFVNQQTLEMMFVRQTLPGLNLGL